MKNHGKIHNITRQLQVLGESLVTAKDEAEREEIENKMDLLEDELDALSEAEIPEDWK